MRVPEHHSASAGSICLQIQIGEDVDDVDGVTIELDDRRVWQCDRPAALVDVAAHGDDRRDAAKPLKDIRRANVAGVDDAIAVLERSDGFLTQQPVSVRDDAYDFRHACNAAVCSTVALDTERP